MGLEKHMYNLAKIERARKIKIKENHSLEANISTQWRKSHYRHAHD